MSVYEFCNLFVEPMIVSVWSLASSSNIWNGFADDIPDNIACIEILSIDSPECGSITINVD